MTTWEDSYYKDDVISNLCRYCNKDITTAERLYRYFNPGYEDLAALKLSDRITSRPKKLLKTLYPHYATKTDKQIVPTILNLAEESKEIYFGLRATYTLLDIIYRGKFIKEEVGQVKLKHDAAIETVRIDHTVSLGSRHKLKGLLSDLELPNSIRRKVDDVSNSANALTHISFCWRAPEYKNLAYKAKRRKLEYPPVPKALIKMPKGWNMYSFPNMVVMIDSTLGANKSRGFFLLHKDVQRLETLCRSLIRAIRYYTIANIHALTPISVENLLGYFTMFIDSLIKTDRHSEVCRAWDVIFNYKFATLANDIWAKSQIEQKRKYDDNNYHKIVSLTGYERFLSGLSNHETLDFLKLYKILPPPDFDPTTGFLKNKHYHDTPWTYGVPHPNAAQNANNLVLSDDDFHSFQVLQLFRRYHRLFKSLPGRISDAGLAYLTAHPQSKLHKFPNVKPDKLSDEEISYIDYENFGAWEYRNTTSSDYYSDKACPPNTRDLANIRDGSAYYDLPLYERNFLMHYLTADDHPNTIQIMKERNYLLYQQTAHFKPESKKPDPRNFFSAKPHARIAMSEWEYNVERYLGKDIAAFISKDPNERATALNSLLGEDYDEKDHKIVYVSFDLDKWSPRYSHLGKKASTRVWSKFFDSPTAKKIPSLSENVSLHYFHHGMHFSYETGVLDAEGQWGKTNTVFHEDVMAYSVRILRKIGMLKYPGKLAVFIDDGLLTLKFDKGEPLGNILKILDYLEYIYFFFGFHISWDKTFVSSNYCQFLAESYYKRNHIDLPFRAFLKMQKTKVLNELSPCGQIKSLVSMARSSSILGVPPHLVLYELCQEVYAIMAKSIRESQMKFNIVPLELALMTLTPTALKGFGVPFTASWLQNPAANSVENFFGICEYLGTIVPSIAKVLISILDQDGKVRSPLSLLRAPNSYRVTGHCLSDMKHYKLVAPVMKSFVRNQLLSWVFSLDLDVLAKDLLVLASDITEVSEVTMLYESSPISQFDKFLSKIKRGNTVLSLLTWRGKRALMNSYYYESLATMKEFISVIRPLK